MRVKLITIGSKMPSWVTQAFSDYQTRLQPYIQLQLIELPLPKRTKTSHLPKLIEAETKSILNEIKSTDFNLALDSRGEQWDSPQLANKLSEWQELGSPINLIIGGPDGLSRSCLERCHTKWSLSKLTFPHPLVRVMVAEQLYRAQSILKGHPYHR